MPTGNKRGAEDSATTRSSKVAKIDNGASTTKAKGAKKGAKAAIPASSFRARALPLHVNISHTPPAIATKEDEANESTAPVPLDPGLVGALTLVPSTFSTGSYGWKGSKRITVELQNSEGGEDGKEKVQVMLTINATVVGSKQAQEGNESKEVTAQEDANGEEAAEEDE